MTGADDTTSSALDGTVASWKHKHIMLANTAFTFGLDISQGGLLENNEERQRLPCRRRNGSPRQINGRSP